MRSHTAKNCSMLELQNVNGCIPSATAAAPNHELVTSLLKSLWNYIMGFILK